MFLSKFCELQAQEETNDRGQTFLKFIKARFASAQANATKVSIVDTLVAQNWYFLFIQNKKIVDT